MSVLVVVQARLGSTRLPGKVLMPLAGAPLLARMLERVRAAKTAVSLVVATTTDAADAPIVQLCDELGVRAFRGHPTDLLDRHVGAASGTDADVVVKIPSDCPLIDPAAIDRVLGAFLAEPDRWDYLGNLHPQSWPDGNDVEVMRRDALERAHREATRPLDREHTTPFLWDHPERFRVGNVLWEGRGDGAPADLSRTHRFTIDYPEDYRLIAAVFEALHRPGERPFALGAILDYLEAHPEVRDLNAAYRNVNWYRHHLAELRTVTASETREPPR